MKITDLRVLGKQLRDFAFIEIETDAGVTGIGVAQAYGPAITALLEAGPLNLRSLVLNEDPADIERLWRKMYRAFTCMLSGPSGLLITALAAIDMALWDLAGKVRGVPVYQLLGGAVQSKLMAYASVSAYEVPENYVIGDPIYHKSRETLVQEARDYVQQGFRAVKFGWGDHFSAADQETLAAIRQALGPEVRLMLDLGVEAFWNVDWNFKRALQAAKICERLDVYFLEEPFTPLDYKSHATLRSKTSVNIATGEMLCTLDEFKLYLDRHAADILQPDASRIGISQIHTVMRMAEQKGILCIPHGPWSALTLASHLNVLLTGGNGAMVEYPGASVYRRGDRWVNRPVYLLNFELAEHPPVLENGFLLPPTRPGLGVGGLRHEVIAELEELTQKGN